MGTVADLARNVFGTCEKRDRGTRVSSEMKERHMRRILVGSVLIMTLAMMYGFAVFYDEIVWNWRSSRIEESKRAGTLIAERIRVFALANHRLPQTLDELVPVYIKDIPNPTAGSQRWLYKVERRAREFLSQILHAGRTTLLQLSQVHL